jgi:hypothetical protein
MAQPSWPVYASIGSQYLPLVAAAVRRRDLTRPRVFVLLWVVIYVLVNVAAVSLARRHINNHFLPAIVTPFQGIAILWALSLWQTRQVARLTIRLAIPCFLVAWAVFTFTIDDVRNFSVSAEPIYSMLALGVALFTLVSRGADATETLTRQDWFWICGGLAIHFAALAVVLPLAAGLNNSNPEVVIRAYYVRAVINVFAFICITIGFLCPKPLAPSGFSFSPAS